MVRYGANVVKIMVYKTLTLEEDSREFRRFMKTQLFRNASRTIARLETDAGGLTAAEVWTEVENLLGELRSLDAADRDIMVSQFYTNEKRRVHEIERDGHKVFREKDDVERTVTCIFYCLALMLEATTKDQPNNPHNDLLDALVEMMIDMDHPILADLHKGIKEDGDKFEKRAGRELIEEHDPLEVEDEWLPQLRKVVEHYANRMYKHVERSHQAWYNTFWNQMLSDGIFIQTMKEPKLVAGDEHKELEVKFNAKCLFNIYGMLYRRGFFVGTIKGETPLAKHVTEHYDSETNDKTKAKYEYFKSEGERIANQFKGMTADVEQHVLKTLKSIMV